MNITKLRKLIRNTINEVIHNTSTTLNECIIAHTVLDDKVILAKNRDRAYTPSISIVRELVNDIEIVYILDKDTDWSEGMNSNGVGIVNSALMVVADENEKKNIKSNGNVGPDGGKIREALSKPTLSKVIQSVTNFKGNGNFALMGHTFICNTKHSFSIEVTSKHKPAINRLDKNNNHVRTNHGYNYENAGYTDGPNKVSSDSRWKLAHYALKQSKKQSDILDGLSGYYPVDMRNNPYRDKTKVTNPTKKDVLSTTGQLLMNLTDLEFVVRMDKNNSNYLGIVDNTPSNYTPKILIKVDQVINNKIR